MHSLGGIRVPPLTAPLRPLQPFLSLSMNSRRNSNCLEPIFFNSLISRGRGHENISLSPQKVSFHKPWSVLGTACLELELRVAFQAFQVCGGLWVKAGWSPALGRLPSSHTCPDIPHHSCLPSARPLTSQSLDQHSCVAPCVLPSKQEGEAGQGLGPFTTRLRACLTYPR